MEKDGILVIAIKEFMDYNETILKNKNCRREIQWHS